MTLAEAPAPETQLEFIRDYAVSIDRLWQAVTTPDQIVRWFGPEGVDLERCDMDFTRTGPWDCVMRGRESGDRFHVSGQITHVRPPKGGQGSVGFTWAWHDGAGGARGAESHVIFEVSTHGATARFRLIHRNLANEEVAQSHTHGWVSTLNKLDLMFS